MFALEIVQSNETAGWRQFRWWAGRSGAAIFGPIPQLWLAHSGAHQAPPLPSRAGCICGRQSVQLDPHRYQPWPLVIAHPKSHNRSTQEVEDKSSQRTGAKEVMDLWHLIVWQILTAATWLTGISLWHLYRFTWHFWSQYVTLWHPYTT